MESVVIKITFAAILFCVCLGAVQEPIINYYWRDYAGVVPVDAVPGGYDASNKITYIGQAFVKGAGNIPGTIYPGEKTIDVGDHGVKTVGTYLKILCSPQLNAFKWVKATSNDFHLTMINKHPVRGGVENTYMLNIGRVAFQGEVVVGKIVTASPDSPGEAPMYFVNNNKEERINSYEVLIYDPPVYKLDVRMQK